MSANTIPSADLRFCLFWENITSVDEKGHVLVWCTFMFHSLSLWDKLFNSTNDCPLCASPLIPTFASDKKKNSVHSNSRHKMKGAVNILVNLTIQQTPLRIFQQNWKPCSTKDMAKHKQTFFSFRPLFGLSLSLNIIDPWRLWLGPLCVRQARKPILMAL